MNPGNGGVGITGFGGGIDGYHGWIDPVDPGTDPQMDKQVI